MPDQKTAERCTTLSRYTGATKPCARSLPTHSHPCHCVCLEPAANRITVSRGENSAVEDLCEGHTARERTLGGERMCGPVQVSIRPLTDAEKAFQPEPVSEQAAPQISDEQIERVAKALYEADPYECGPDWKASRVWPPSLQMSVDGFRHYARTAIEAAAPAPTVGPLDLDELRDVIAECLYEAANTDEQGPGGSVKHWAGWADTWLMGRVGEFVAGVVASREAEVRRQTVREVHTVLAAMFDGMAHVPGGDVGNVYAGKARDLILEERDRR